MYMLVPKSLGPPDTKMGPNKKFDDLYLTINRY